MSSNRKIVRIFTFLNISYFLFILILIFYFYRGNTGKSKKISIKSEQIGGRDQTFSDEDSFDADGIEGELPLDIVSYDQVKMYSTDVLNTHIILSSISTVKVTQISCSDNHTLI